MRSALIIGASGQDGRLLAPFLSKRAYSVRGWVRQEPATPLSCEYAVTDILQRETVAADLQTYAPNEIYYLAAFHDSTEALAEIETGALLRRSFDVHVLGLLNVLQAMKAYCPHARLFYAASSHVFGGRHQRRQE